MLRTLRPRVKKAFAALSSPNYIRAARFGVFATIEHAVALRGHKFDCILDIGANRGQFALFAQNAFPEAKVICFEPLKSAAERFSQVFAGASNIRMINAAVGRTAGRARMVVANQDDSSSLLEPTSQQKTIFGITAKGFEDVDVGPLSNYISEADVGEATLLKIDTQGYELEVLKGCGSLLGRVSAIYCEGSFVELYRGQALVDEIIAYLRLQEFILAGIFNPVTVRNKIIQGDFLFLRRAGIE